MTIGVDSRRKGDLKRDRDRDREREREGKREKARGNQRYGMGEEVRTI